MDFKKYKNRLKEYLSSKGYSNFNNNISCPFHKDKNPSMKVYDEIAKCFSGCDKKDIYDFVGLFENLNTKVEQFKFVEKMYGDSISDYKEKKFEIDIEAYNKVYEYIKKQIKTKKGQDYIKRFTTFRKYDKNFSRYFGYWNGLNEAKKELSIEILEKAGIPLPEKDKKYSSWSPQGVVCKFENGFKLLYVRKDLAAQEYKTYKMGSRGGHTFPYPNMPKKNIILIEAEISAIGMRINGFDNTVATGGINGINNADIDRLLELEEIIICFDGDKQGIEASEKLAKKIWYKTLEKDKKINIKIVELPKNNDPDDLIVAGKLNILKECILNAKLYKQEDKNDSTDNMPIMDDNCDNITDSVEPIPAELNIEKSFFVENSLEAEKYRKDTDEVKQLIFARKDLAAQESARLYFCEKIKTGIKLVDSVGSQVIYLYDQKEKHWKAKIQRINQEPFELFIKKYGAMWYVEGSSKPFLYQKNNRMRNEIESHFQDIVFENLKTESDPFSHNVIPKIINCKNCILEYNGKLEKFEEKKHDKNYNLTVSPFNFNRIDLNNLTESQKEKTELIRQYFSNLVDWIEDKEEKNKMVIWLLAYIGYTLTSWREKCFHVWIGEPDSGKTELTKIISLIHKSKYAETKFADWSNHRDQHQYEILPGKLIIVDDDFRVNGKLPEQELKTLSQNATITINPKHFHRYGITNTATPLILTNGNPRAEDLCVENRLYAVPFNADFSREKRNSKKNDMFINKIKEHETLELLFNMAINIAETTIFKYNNFSDLMPGCVKEKTEQVINTASSTMMWLDDMQAQDKLIIDRNNNLLRIKKTQLYNLYKTNSTGIKKGLHGFYASVRQKFKEVKSNGYWYFTGISEKSIGTDYTESVPKYKFEE